MDVFDVRDRVVGQYAEYVRGFLSIREPSTRAFIDDYLRAGRLWPEQLVQLNPSFQPGATVDELVSAGVLHPECSRIFRRRKADTSWGDPLRLHRHQEEAIRVAQTGTSFVLTTGTGSGKSLTYFIPIILGDPDAIRDEGEFLMSLNRFNVMASRARAKLVVLVSRKVVDHLSGDLDVLHNSRLLKTYAERFCASRRPMTLG